MNQRLIKKKYIQSNDKSKTKYYTKVFLPMIRSNCVISMTRRFIKNQLRPTCICRLFY